MITEVKIQNYKSIPYERIPLGRVNVFIGENGCGKTNILEAIAFFCAAKINDLSPDGLSNRGIRVTKPALTFSSFLNNKRKDKIEISLTSLNGYSLNDYSVNLTSSDSDNIYSEWKNDNDDLSSLLELLYGNEEQEEFKEGIINQLVKDYLKKQKKPIINDEIKNFVIYNLSSNALRGITNLSKEIPLGIFGEGLDVLLANLSDKEIQQINSSNFITWLKSIYLDKNDELKLKGHKLGRSTSYLYFIDKYMKRDNNIFAAENANEGALFVLFYLALFISKQTPAFFAIDNIETALNPKLCRDLMKSINELAKVNNKQALITTHNPAILDGLNLFDEDQKLFVVKRTDQGFTKVEQIKLKPDIKDKDLKLSEMWMRGYIGGLSRNDF